MKKSIFILIIYLLINRCSAFDLTRATGGRAAAMGRTSVCSKDLWALQNNPAGLAYLKGWHFGLYYENQWLLKETAFKSGGIVKSFDRIGCFGMLLTQFGGADYSENQFGIVYARDFGPYLQMGLRFEYLLFHWGDGNPNRGAPSFELGIQSQVTEKLRLGATIYNPIRARLMMINEDPLPIDLCFGLSYQFTDGFVAQCELEKNSERAGIQLRSGFEYQVFKRFFLRAGVQCNPILLSFGIGYEIHHLHVDVAAQLHQALGTSLQIGMEYSIP